MLICPGCKAVLKQAPEGGVCPKCGHAVRDAGVETDGPHSPTLDATQDFAPQGKPETQQPSVTMSLPAAGKQRSISIAPRKLSAKNVEQITNTWQSAVVRGDQQSSLKLESKGTGSVGGGSSLVVNLRGVRSADPPTGEIPRGVRPTTGADYELLQVIGKGGMGVVYSARQASVDRMVAVKMIRPTGAGDAERRAKFLSEAVVTGDLDHPNIVPIYELGTDERNALFYSMKRVQGTPWSHVIGQKPLAENLEVLMKVADAVAFAHSNGVVHRDLKPENVMLGDFGEVLVMDWGLALATTGFRHAEFVTRDDSMGGTPAYMAPEMVTGPFDLIGPACDVYLLGALLFEVVTGLRPHTGRSTQECLLAAARNDIQPTDVKGELVDIAYRAMATDPGRRYASVQEFQSAIRDYQSHMESISLAGRADQELAGARVSGDYQAFARAVFGFEEALALWSGNTRAREGISEARLAYSACAKDKGDFELGVSLLDADNPDHAALRGELEAAQRERDARHKWLARFRRIAAALVVVVFAVITAALFFVTEARNQETAAKQRAFEDRDKARKAEAAAERAREEAVAAEKQAQKERNLARQAAEAEAAAKREEQRQKTEAVAARRTAEKARAQAVRARRGEEQAAYVARIGMAAAKIDENAFDTAEALLAACQPTSLRNWEWGYLKRLCRRGFNFPATGTVHAVAFAPDGSSFVTAGEDRQAHVWDRNTRSERFAVEHPADIRAAAFSPDGRYLATGCSDGVVRIIDAAAGQVEREIAAHRDRVLDVAFSPDGRWLVSASRDNTAGVWETATGRAAPGAPLVGHYGWVWSAAFAPDGNRIVTAGQDGKVIVWSFRPAAVDSPAAAIAPRKVFLGHRGAVFAAAFSPDGRQVASGGYDKRVLMWEPDAIEDVDLTQLVSIGESLAPQQSRALEGHAAPIRTLAFSPDGQYLFTGGDDNTVRIWDVVTARPHAILRGHSRPVLACAIAPDASQVVTGGQEDTIKLWDLVNYKPAPPGQVLAGHEDAVLAAAFSPDGARVVTGSRDHTARVFEADSAECTSLLKEGHEFLATRGVFFDDGKRLLTAGGDNTARLWDAASGAELDALEGTGRSAAVAVSPDGRWIVTGKYVRNDAAGADARQQLLRSSPQLAVWDLDAERRSVEARQLPDEAFGTGHPGDVSIVAISPDGRLLFSGDTAGMCKLWNAQTGAEVTTLAGHTGGITGAVFVPDGSTLLTASKDGTVARWDVASGQERKPWIALGDPSVRDAFDTPVTGLALSADGRQLATLSETTTDSVRQSVVQLWSVEDATLVRELYRGAEQLISVAYSADGHAVLAAGRREQPETASSPYAQSFVRRFSVDSGQEQPGAGGGPFLDLAGRRELVRAALETPDARAVLTIGGNGAALWNAANPGEPELLFKPHSGVTAAGFSADGQKVVTGSSDRRIKIWDTATSQAEMQLPAAHAAAITSARFSPAEPTRLLTAAGDGTARLWDLDARRVLQVFDHAGADRRRLVHCAIFSPDGRHVLTAGEDGAIRTWDAASGQQAASFAAGTAVYSAAFARDGRRILAGLGDGRAIILEARSLRPLVEYAGHTDAVNSVAFSPDGRRALTGSRDRLVKVWDTEVPGSGAAEAPTNAEQPANDSAEPRAGKELLTLRYHDQPVTSVAFSPDGRTVLTASLDGTAVLWPTDVK